MVRPVRVRAPPLSPSLPFSSSAAPRERSSTCRPASANHSPSARPVAGARAAAVAVVAVQLQCRPRERSSTGDKFGVS
jgi:hypothetical protein